ncbi:Hypothetical predicted protein [Olea europaea subsp. europaea]|uniref:Uncharacterized protein n=1 Tax=Olea europaea subsp. europaea TaxID=158383 RepID=A0A8S0U2D2_OLEEU|nr:Hypothetical predicted protein [Olea europaea subsp. europaea]
MPRSPVSTFLEPATVPKASSSTQLDPLPPPYNSCLTDASTSLVPMSILQAADDVPIVHTVLSPSHDSDISSNSPTPITEVDDMERPLVSEDYDVVESQICESTSYSIEGRDRRTQAGFIPPHSNKMLLKLNIRWTDNRKKLTEMREGEQGGRDNVYDQRRSLRYSHSPPTRYWRSTSHSRDYYSPHPRRRYSSLFPRGREDTVEKGHSHIHHEDLKEESEPKS